MNGDVDGHLVNDVVDNVMLNMDCVEVVYYHVMDSILYLSTNNCDLEMLHNRPL